MTRAPWWTTVKSADLLELRRRLVIAIRHDFPTLIEAQVEDVVQHAFMALFKRRQAVDSDNDGLFRYLKVTASNKGLDQIKTAKLRKGRAAAVLAAAARNDASSENVVPRSGAEAAEDAEEIWRVFCALDDLDRLVLWCHVVDGRSIRAVARDMNMNWHRVADMVERALRRVRAGLRAR